jgi:surface protein
VAWKSMGYAFYKCTELTYKANDTPDLDEVYNMSGMFLGAVKFNGAIGDWDVSSVITMIETFNMASSFNQPLADWDVSNVENMLAMFLSAESFNQPINNWNVNHVTDMSYMFTNAQSFNQKISGWNVSNVNTMFKMFENASSFDKNLGNWNLSSIGGSGNLRDMLDNSGLSIVSYETTLKGWSESANTPTGIQLGAEKLVYCSNGETYRNALIEKDWIFYLDIKGTDINCE